MALPPQRLPAALPPCLCVDAPPFELRARPLTAVFPPQAVSARHSCRGHRPPQPHILSWFAQRPFTGVALRLKPSALPTPPRTIHTPPSAKPQHHSIARPCRVPKNSLGGRNASSPPPSDKSSAASSSPRTARRSAVAIPTTPAIAQPAQPQQRPNRDARRFGRGNAYPVNLPVGELEFLIALPTGIQDAAAAVPVPVDSVCIPPCGS